MPTIYVLAIQCFKDMFPSEWRPSDIPDDQLVLALRLARQYNIQSALKPIYYALSQFDFHTEDLAGGTDEIGALSPAIASLPKEDLDILSSLHTSLIQYFTPILFTVSGAAHMACTDVFADTWMDLVIHPALVDSGVAKPLETLERIKKIDWSNARKLKKSEADHAVVGLCDSCVASMIEEWSEEQKKIWTAMDQWLPINEMTVVA
ncbi:hypothetical protein FISHEDRAFT_54840 [Fistulina hepatica ATCC 64428]|uniref:Uncharacterized protein n=1 Tax=Fistulina hepatica ATCC 64428 TaxID=1128425 RepID=A0A0D7APQ7_9AGAR|nr:hypothetical protein FISHEDRAFT_54840 [Fistulina hepatica ATCC 64428]